MKQLFESSSRRAWLAALLLGAVTLAAYLNSFSAGLVFDNRGLILQDPRLRAITAENLSNIFRHSYWWPYGESGLYRPLTTLTYLFNYSILGNATAPAGYHAFNFAFHLLNVYLAWALLRRLRPAFSPVAAWFGAALWAVHPVLTESVTNVVGRADLLAGSAILGGLLLHLKAEESTGLRRWLLLAALALVSLAGAYSKESAVILPVAIVLYETVAVRSAGRELKGLLATLPGVVVALAHRSMVLAQAPPAFFPPWDNPLTVMPFLPAKLSALKVLAMQIGLLFWPQRLSCDYSFAAILPFAGRPADWAALAGLLLLAAATVLTWKHQRALCFLILFALLALLPTSNLLFPLGTMMAERFLYLPALAAAGCAVFLIEKAGVRFSQARVAWAVLGVLVVLLGVRTGLRNADWRDEVTLMRSAVEAAPGSYKTHALLASALRAAGSPVEQARAETDASLQILQGLPEPLRPPSVYEQAGRLAFEAGDAARARELLQSCRRIAGAQYGLELKRAEALKRPKPQPDVVRFANLEWGIMAASLQLRDAPAALESARRALDFAPLVPLSYRHLAVALHANGDRDGAAVALAQGVIVTHDMKLRDALMALYRSGLDTKGCAAAQGPNGPALNVDCPIVKAHTCTAVEATAKLYERLGKPNEAAQLRRSAPSGCPATAVPPGSVSGAR